MDFSKSRHGLVTPYFPSKRRAPTDEDVPAGADFWVWDQTIGPAEGNGTGRSAQNPMSLLSDPMPSLLASTLNWKVPRARK